MLEMCAYHWVQVPESTARYLSNEYGIIDAYHHFNKCGVEHREYHIDTHPILFQFVRKKEMGGDLSVRKEKKEKPIIFIGQDETVFKQFSYSKKAWHAPTGQTQLLPKSDGYSRMISAYVSRVFGLGIHLSQEQLKTINKDKRSGNR